MKKITMYTEHIIKKLLIIENKMTLLLYYYWRKSLYTSSLYQPLNIFKKPQKSLTQQIKELGFKILGTSIIYSPMSPPLY